MTPRRSGSYSSSDSLKPKCSTLTATSSDKSRGSDLTISPTPPYSSSPSSPIWFDSRISSLGSPIILEQEQHLINQSSNSTGDRWEYLSPGTSELDADFSFELTDAASMDPSVNASFTNAFAEFIAWPSPSHRQQGEEDDKACRDCKSGYACNALYALNHCFTLTCL